MGCQPHGRVPGPELGGARRRETSRSSRPTVLGRATVCHDLADDCWHVGSLRLPPRAIAVLVSTRAKCHYCHYLSSLGTGQWYGCWSISPTHGRFYQECLSPMDNPPRPPATFGDSGEVPVRCPLTGAPTGQKDQHAHH